jgi:hypothetical protein
MYIEKNICDSILGTLINILGKTKDTANARRDLREIGIHKELHLQTNGATTTMPLAAYTLAIDEKNWLCKWLKCVKFSDKYTSNIDRYVNKLLSKISGMKSHDCHIFLQCLLPIAIREKLTPEIETTLIEMGNFFKQLCTRILKVDILKQMKIDIILILCKMEQIFSLAIFDVMVHLPREAKLGDLYKTVGCIR